MSPVQVAPWKIKGNMTIEQRFKDKSGSWITVEEKSKKIKRILRLFLLIVFILSLGIFIFLLFFKPPLPDKNKIIDKVIYQEPFQNKDIIGEQLLTKGNYRYKIYTQFSYELYGLVVSEYDSENFLDVMHKKDPAQIKDLCVVWGNNIISGIYKNIKYKSGEFTCFAEPKEGTNWSAFSMRHLSNNHLIPANDEIAEKIRKASVGDQVYVKGYLSRYEVYDQSGNLISSRETSVRRDDGGNGACETIFVTDFNILQGRNYLYKMIRVISGIVAVFSFIVLLILAIL